MDGQGRAVWGGINGWPGKGGGCRSDQIVLFNSIFHGRHLVFGEEGGIDLGADVQKRVAEAEESTVKSRHVIRRL